MKKEIKLALSVIFALVLLFYGIHFLKGVNLLKKNNFYYVVFNDITGLAKNNAVYANGFPIGTVQQIDFDYANPGKVYVGIQVDENMRIPTGSRAELVSTMLGTTTMNLILSESKQYLNPGDSITGSPQEGALAQASKMLPKIEAMLPKLDSILQSINTLVADPAIASTLHNTEKMSANLIQTTEEINKLLKNDLPRLTAKLNTIGENIEHLTGKLNEVEYAETVKNINNTLTETQGIIQNLNNKLNSQNSTVGLLVNDRSLYDNLNSTLLSVDSLLNSFKKDPRVDIHMHLFSKKKKTENSK